MIKHAEVQNAYLLGRQAAMEKIANPNYAGTKAILDEVEEQNKIRDLIGLGGKGLTVDDLDTKDTGYSVLNPSNYATKENLARLAMLSGAVGGQFLGGTTPQSAAFSSAGALGGGQIGGNLGRALAAATGAYRGPKAPLATETIDQIISNTGALGGLAGGLGAGYLSGR
jgi:hypothetical protein